MRPPTPPSTRSRSPDAPSRESPSLSSTRLRCAGISPPTPRPRGCSHAPLRRSGTGWWGAFCAPAGGRSTSYQSRSGPRFATATGWGGRIPAGGSAASLFAMTPASPEAAFWSGKVVAVTGGAGFLGRRTVAILEDLGAEVRVVRSAEHDLRDRAACFDALRDAQVVLHLAANVGGIGYNRRNPAPLAHDNLAMGLNVFEACRELGVEKLVAACSVCAYPKFTPVPFKEDDLWDGYPEESNAPYGLAKKMLLVLSDAYRRQYGL